MAGRAATDPGSDRAAALDLALRRGAEATYTLLFTDIEGSTHLWETYPGDMEGVVRAHYELTNDAITSAHGRVVRRMGDGVFAIFVQAADAVAAAVDIQRRIGTMSWAPIGELRLRMGINTGTCRIHDGELYGRPPNLAARLEAASHGGQILASNATAKASAGALPHDVELINLGRYPIRGLDEPVVIHSVMADGLRQTFPPPRTPYRGLDELPDDDAPLFGRDELVETVMTILAGHRLVTLWGPGGVGKSRLAQRVARLARRPYDDGVRFVDLSAPRGGEDRAARAVAGALRAQAAAGESEPDTVLRVLQPARLLLVLDNCESELGGIRLLVEDVLDRCPGVSVLVTSREALWLRGEQAVNIPTLGLPPVQSAEAGPVLETAAVRLFVERARDRLPDFTVDDGNAAAVAAVCRGLDGLPLALELVAARLDVETIDELAADLPLVMDRLAAPGAPARKGGLTDPVAMGLAGLEAAETDLFCRLAAFSGSFPRELGVAMAGDDPTAQRSFDHLVRTSLVVRDPSAPGRFRLLAHARHVGRARRSAAERLLHRSLHAALMLTRAEQWGPLVRTADEAACVAVLKADFPDHAAAIEFLLDHGGYVEAGRMIVALSEFALFQPRPEVHGWAATAATRLADDAPNTAAVIGIAALGSWYAGDTDLALAMGQRAVAVSDAHGGSTIWARTALVNAFAYSGDMAGVATHFLALRDELRASSDPFWQVHGLCYEAISYAMSGLAEQAEARARRAVAIARQLGNPDTTHWALHGLGRALSLTDNRAAAAAFEAAMEAARSVGSRWNVGLNLVEWVGLQRVLGDERTASSGALDLLEMLVVTGNRSQLSQALREAGLILATSGRHEVAATILLARQGLPCMPKAASETPGDEALLTELRTELGADWGRLAVRAGSVPEHELISLCRSELAELRRTAG